MSDIFVDFTHVARRASGIERVTKGLFSAHALAPLPVKPIYASGSSRLKLVLAQCLKLPAVALANAKSVFIFPGYPPSFFFPIDRVRTILYVHDVFLLTRRNDLNRAARYYMAPQFSRALREGRTFYCNSEDTERKLRPLIDSRARTLLFRPAIDNVFGLSAGDRVSRPSELPVLKIVAVGTVEPRKNFRAGARICAALARQLGRPVEYHVIGRRGWGSEWDAVAVQGNAILHGYLDEEQARRVIEDADAVLCTSHEEGLGLPLLELQYAGLAVIAPDAPVFHEVLGNSGIFIDVEATEDAASRIAGAFTDGWRDRFAKAAAVNLARWNGQAASDRERVIAHLRDLAA